MGGESPPPFPPFRRRRTSLGLARLWRGGRVRAGGHTVTDIKAVNAGEKKISRKDFLKMTGRAAAATAAAHSLRPLAATAAEGAARFGGGGIDLSGLPSDAGGADQLVRMQRDLARALAKPKAKRTWAMAIDTRKCIGCFACTISCIAENKLPPGVVYRPVIEEESGTYPSPMQRFWPRPCLQCDNPPCVPVCPVDATHKREDGIVVIDYEKCIGCRYCITACPYGARYSDFGEYYASPLQPYERIPSFEYDRAWYRGKGRSPIGNARKCHFCSHLIERGSLPRCVSTCVGRATYFGDLSDGESLISEVSLRRDIVRLKEDLGTRPKVFFLI